MRVQIDRGDRPTISDIRITTRLPSSISPLDNPNRKEGLHYRRYCILLQRMEAPGANQTTNSGADCR